MTTTPSSTALDGGFDEPMGRYHYDVATDHWWWSGQMYALHGFTPGEVTPTTALLQAHLHPDDYEFAVKTLQAARFEASEYCCRYRIIDARRKIHTVVLLGRSIAPNGVVEQMTGYLVDVTESERLHSLDAVQDAVEQSARSRAVIEQAKGALMLSHGLTGEEAFSLLRRHSQHHNIKLRDLAATMVQSLTHPDLGIQTVGHKVVASLLDPTRTSADGFGPAG